MEKTKQIFFDNRENMKFRDSKEIVLDARKLYEEKMGLEYSYHHKSRVFDNPSSKPNSLFNNQQDDDEKNAAPSPVVHGEIEEIEDGIERKFRKFKNLDTLNSFPLDHHFLSERHHYFRVDKQYLSLKTGLAGSSIFVRVYDERTDLMSAVIVGRETTPYHQGLFFFDIRFSKSSPQIFFKSFGLDLSPNLQKNGTVVALENKVSNILELLSSLRDLVVNDKSHIKKNLKLNKRVFVQTCEAMIKMLGCPPRGFQDFVLGYFRTRAHQILLSFKACVDLEDKAMKSLFFKLVRAFEANGTYCRHHYNQKQYDRALKEEEELLGQRYGYRDSSMLSKVMTWNIL